MCVFVLERSQDGGLYLLAAMEHDLQHILLVGLGPRADRELRHLQADVTESRHVAVDNVFGGLRVDDGPCEMLVVRHLAGGMEGH